jgi:hypothetical protein
MGGRVALLTPKIMSCGAARASFTLSTMTLHIGAGPVRLNISKFPASSKEFCSTVSCDCLEQHWKLPVLGNFAVANRSCVSPASSFQHLQHFTHEIPSRYSAATGGNTRRGGQSSTARTPTAFYIDSPCGSSPAGPVWRNRPGLSVASLRFCILHYMAPPVQTAEVLTLLDDDCDQRWGSNGYLR